MNVINSECHSFIDIREFVFAIVDHLSSYFSLKSLLSYTLPETVHQSETNNDRCTKLSHSACRRWSIFPAILRCAFLAICCECNFACAIGHSLRCHSVPSSAFCLHIIKLVDFHWMMTRHSVSVSRKDINFMCDEHTTN
jgi:hypothetical protein